ncbi:uncharacterized protein F4812DRAFT_416981 [Daldinia caldariorum]|uniref:uncharacterized protein n=1 Tax=Daldinia caldariorum TaxID=326644 RepID=UPI002008C564|nr:uncharacterized protein F4812DRAFT_416981 [Daldinia caldariorum]KAI1470300.1 hypothetical protein F4812DRAFT_416981 [Daldinia caldariorum]
MPYVKRRRPDPDPEERIWEQHKSTFQRLYQTERRTLEEVKRIMESQHGFPVNSLSTYEFKLRDELHLRKKLKKNDWVPIHHHLLKRGDKPTAVYLNGTKIPQHKVWKEIRRSGARLVANGQDIPLPRDVVVRTPSPVGYLVSSTPQTRHRDIHNLSPQLWDSPVMTLSAPPSSTDIAFGSRNAVQQSQTHVDLPMSRQVREIKVMELLGSAPEHYITALLSTPWANFSNYLRQVVFPRHLSSEYSEALHHCLKFESLALMMATESEPRSPDIARETVFPPRQLPMPNHTTTSSSLTFEMNAFYILSKAMYMISNNLLDDRIDGHILDLLLSRVPYAVLKSLFQVDLPTARETWQCLADYAGIKGYRDIFVFLMKIGLLHRDWIIPMGASYLSDAVSMGAIDVVKALLKIGARADGKIEVRRRLPIVEAAATGNLECLQLLMTACDLNSVMPVDDLETPFDTFVDTLHTGSIISGRRDHAYPPNSFEDLKNSLISVEFSLENEPQSQALDILLESGADVDALWLYWEHKSEKFMPTILEQSYYMDIELFYRLAPYSTETTRIFFRPDLCLFAKQGRESLMEYWTSEPKRLGSDGSEFLELVLTEQFSDLWVADIEVVRGLCELIINPNAIVPGKLWHIVTQARTEGITEHFAPIVTALLQSGAVLDLAVMEAGVEEEGIGILQILKELGADLGRYGTLALSTAARLENYEAVSWLLEAGADIHAQINLEASDRSYEPWSVVALASVGSLGWRRCEELHGRQFFEQHSSPASFDMLRYLIDHGAELKISPHDPNAAEFLRRVLVDGWSAYLARSNIPDLVSFFLSNLDPRDLSSSEVCLLDTVITLPCSIDSNHRQLKMSLFKVLRAHGAPMPTGRMIPWLICEGNALDLIQELLEHCSDVDNLYQEVPSIHKCTLNPLQAAAYEGNEDMFDKLIAMRANINMPAFEGSGMTALEAAAYRGHIALVRRLVHMGADVNAASSSALQAACRIVAKSTTEMANKMEIIKLLIENGAEVNANSGEALNSATREGDIEVAIILLCNGADVNMASEWGKSGSLMTPLDCAARTGRIDMVQFLLNLGALSHDRGQTGYDGAIAYAEGEHFFTIADLIRKHHAEDFKLLGTNIALSFVEEEPKGSGRSDEPDESGDSDMEDPDIQDSGIEDSDMENSDMEESDY